LRCRFGIRLIAQELEHPPIYLEDNARGRESPVTFMSEAAFGFGFCVGDLVICDEQLFLEKEQLFSIAELR
jgi:hypothetical protein